MRGRIEGRVVKLEKRGAALEALAAGEETGT